MSAGVVMANQIREIAHLRSTLAECFAATGANPPHGEEPELCWPYAVDAVREMRQALDATRADLQAMRSAYVQIGEAAWMRQLEAERDRMREERDAARREAVADCVAALRKHADWLDKGSHEMDYASASGMRESADFLRDSMDDITKPPPPAAPTVCGAVHPKHGAICQREPGHDTPGEVVHMAPNNGHQMHGDTVVWREPAAPTDREKT